MEADIGIPPPVSHLQQKKKKIPVFFFSEKMFSSSSWETKVGSSQGGGGEREEDGAYLKVPGTLTAFSHAKPEIPWTKRTRNESRKPGNRKCSCIPHKWALKNIVETLLWAGKNLGNLGVWRRVIGAYFWVGVAHQTEGEGEEEEEGESVCDKKRKGEEQKTSLS